MTKYIDDMTPEELAAHLSSAFRGSSGFFHQGAAGADSNSSANGTGATGMNGASGANGGEGGAFSGAGGAQGSTPPPPPPPPPAGAVVQITNIDTARPLAPIDEPRWITPEIVRGTVSVIASAPGVGKSLYAVALAMSLSRNTPKAIGVDKFGYPGVTFYVSNEDSEQHVELRRRAWLLGNKVNQKKAPNGLMLVQAPNSLVSMVVADAAGVPRLNTTAADTLEAEIDVRRQVGSDVAMVVLDTLITCVAGVEENDNSAMAAAMALLGGWAAKMDVAVVALAHTAKANGHSGIGRLRGASATGGSVRAAIEFRRLPEEDEERLPVREQNRWIFTEGMKASYALRPTRRWYFIRSEDVPTISRQGGTQANTTTSTAWLEPRDGGPFPPFDPGSVLTMVDALEVLLARAAAGDTTGASMAGRHKGTLVKVLREGMTVDGEEPTLKEAKAIAKALIEKGHLQEKTITDKHRNKVEGVEVTQQGKDLVSAVRDGPGRGAPAGGGEAPAGPPAGAGEGPQ